MALSDTIGSLRTLINNISRDLDKAGKGNKAASQRVRTGTIRLEKVAKLFRKESVKAGKAMKGRKSFKKVGKKASKKAGSKKAVKSRIKVGKKKKIAKGKKIVRKKSKKTASRARALSIRKRATAKIPRKRARARAR